MTDLTLLMVDCHRPRPAFWNIMPLWVLTANCTHFHLPVWFVDREHRVYPSKRIQLLCSSPLPSIHGYWLRINSRPEWLSRIRMYWLLSCFMVGLVTSGWKMNGCKSPTRKKDEVTYIPSGNKINEAVCVFSLDYSPSTINWDIIPVN